MLACWQLLEGAEPAQLRRQLAAALPNAPPARVQAVRCRPAQSSLLTDPHVAAYGRMPITLLWLLIRTGCMVACTLSCGDLGVCCVSRQPDILHMTLARVLKPPVASGSGAAALQRAAAAMTAELCGTQTSLRNIWCMAVSKQDSARLQYLQLPPSDQAAHLPNRS